MAATYSYVTKDDLVNHVYTGSFTSDSTAGDHTLYFDEHVIYFQVIIDSGGTNPNILIKHGDETDETYLLDGGPTQALATSPADSVGITFDLQGGGKSTVVIDNTVQTNSGTNQWVAFTRGYGS